MTKEFKPLLAKAVEFEHLDYGNTWVSPKYDGIRAIVRNGVVMSRSLKPIPNKHVQQMFGFLEHFDGELIVGPPNAPDVYLRTYSGVMAAEGRPDVEFYVFDHVEFPTEEYFKRRDRIRTPYLFVNVVPQHPVTDEASVLALEEMFLNTGYEGIMLREFSGPRSMYKYGRSTARECTLLKLKRLDDFEAKIIGFEEEMFNGNEKTIDVLGHTVRSSHQENKVGKDTMGVMLFRTDDGVEFRCGIFKGQNASWKKYVWDHQGEFIDNYCKLQKLGYGEKDKPRHPRMIACLGLRSPIDM